MQNKENANERVKDILEKINENGGPTVTEEEGSVEFSFPKVLPKTALVFEEDNGAEIIEEAEAEAEKASAEDAPLEEVPEEVAFDIGKSGEEDTGIVFENTSSDMIWKTYVPRFTEATERTYRVLDEDEYLERQKSAKEISVRSESKAESSSFKSATEEIEDKSKDEAVVINVGGEESQPLGTVNVFKFETDKKPVIEKTPEEIEKEEMDELFGRKKEPLPGKAPEIDKVRDGDDKDDLPLWDEKNGVFAIPDPVIDDNRGAVAESIPLSELPCGAADSVITDQSQSRANGYIGKRDRFKDKFLDMLMATRLRLIIVIALAAIMLVFENIPAVSNAVAYKLNIHDTAIVGVIADIGLSVALLIMAAPEIFGAFAALRRKVLRPEIILVPVYAGFLAYSIAAIGVPGEYLYLGSAFAVLVVFAVVGTYLVQSSDFCAFKLVSEKVEKLVADTRYTRTLDRENIALDGAVVEYKSKIARDFKTLFVSKFFTNSAKRRENSKNNLVIILCVVLTSSAIGVMGYFIKDMNFLWGLYAFVLSLSFGSPAFFILSHKLPFHSIEKRMVERGTAVIGEEAFYDSSEVDVIVFEDKEVFGDDDVAFKSVTLGDRNGDFRKAMRKMSSLFSAVGGPLSRLFAKTLNKQYTPAQSVEIEDDGISGVVDGVTVYAGNADYMRRHGITVPEDSQATLESTKVMYGAEGDCIFAKFSIQYSFSEEFALMIKPFAENGITPLIYTRDPNINNELVSFLIGGKCKIRVMRKNSVLPAEHTTYKSLSSTLVTVGDKSDLIDAIMASKSYTWLMSELKLMELIASLAGLVIAVLLYLTGALSVNLSATVCVWHVLLSVLFGVFSKRIYSGKRKGNK